MRRDIWRLSKEDPWHPVILNYAKAVWKLRTYDGGNFADPRSWGHLAAIHGTYMPTNERPSGVLWDECEHGSWHFLPWHRVYLHHFERIVRAAVVEIGGPADWALPYWNYSDPTRVDVRRLPPAFREQELPGSTTQNRLVNPLFVPLRAAGMNAKGELKTDFVKNSVALGEPVFADPLGGQAIAGFGGGVGPRIHDGNRPGSLETKPHNSVHMAVGGLHPSGWMSDPQTAAQDPIFWLHHANIDRLWAEWLRSPTPPHKNPTESQWLKENFEFGSGAWHTILTTEAVLDSRSAPLRYRYDDEPVSAITVVPGPVPPRPDLEAAVRRGPPEVIGATQGQVALGPAPTHAEIEVAEARAAGLESFAGDRQPQRVYLTVENVRGTELSAGSFHVYVNAPAKASAAQLEDHLAGTISLFGIELASRRTERHAGGGLSFSFDITGLVRRLQAAQTWNPKKLRVTFVPISDSSDLVYPGDLKVGRVGLYRG